MPAALRIEIAARRSEIEVWRHDGVSCSARVSVEVADRQVRIAVDGKIPCADGAQLDAVALRCLESAAGDADCVGTYAIDRPIRVALARRPVIGLSWEDATAYADWLSSQTGRRYRLPSEGEWAYAARAGTETPFWTGACIHTDQANYNGDYDYAACGARTGVYRYRRQTVPAGCLPPNPWGLHEVAGNVWEWVQDCWHDSFRDAPSDGGAWLDADVVEVGRTTMFLMLNFLGFRLAQAI